MLMWYHLLQRNHAVAFLAYLHFAVVCIGIHPRINARGFLRRRIKWRFWQAAFMWRQRTRKRLGAVGERSGWWIFIPTWKSCIGSWLQDFRVGRHQFSPMVQYKFIDEVVQVWSYLDRLMMHLLLLLMRPTFKHIISPRCLHLAGPTVIKQATAEIKAALDSGRFNYVMRIDIRSYYASINHRLLIQQVTQHYDDPILLRYYR